MNPYQTVNRGPFVASTLSRVFHRAECFEVEHIKPQHKQFFNSAAAARAAGHRPCEICKPY
jgi:methylated-DNA-[protein]-cysteine S-methyltransferase